MELPPSPSKGVDSAIILCVPTRWRPSSPSHLILMSPTEFIRFLRDERHHRAEELADALGRRVLLKFQRAEDLALRGARRGERKGDEIIRKAASHRCQTALRVTGRSAPLKGDGNLRLGEASPPRRRLVSQNIDKI